MFFLNASLAWTQFRQLNPMSYLSTENPSFVVSPLDYNKAGVYRQTNGAGGFQAQMNLDRIYSAVGIDLYDFTKFSCRIRCTR
jgi:hypothetical protein